MGTLTEDTIIQDALQVLMRCEHLVGEASRRLMRQFDTDSRTDFFIISVLGEFKRGKSTLINALLAQDLLPRDVTPTTATISVLRYSTDPMLTVHWADGTEETRSLGSDALQVFTVATDFDPDTVDYLEVGVNADILRNGFVIVDTPGVDDLNNHRSEVACRFVPRSDVVVFVLSAATPVRKSETEFLDANILEAGLDHILFVANFADMVDEEIDTVVTDITRRLSPVLGTRKAKVIPLSASGGLQSAIGGDLDMQVSTGLDELRRSIAELAESTSRFEIRQRRLLHRARLCIKEYISDIEQTLALMDHDIKSLQNELANIDVAIAAKNERRARLDMWLEDRRAEILAMVRKSLRHFEVEVDTYITEQVDDYKATDFKEFIEEKVPRHIKKYCKMWIEGHAGPMNTLLNNLDARIIEALGAEFEAHVPRLRSERMLTFDGVDTLSLQAEDVSTAPQRAGLLAGGAAAGLLLLHASLFVPIIGMAALPFLMKGMTESQLKSAKEKIRLPLKEALERTLSAFEARVIDVVSSDIDTLALTAEERFDELMTELRERVSGYIQERSVSEHKSRETVSDLQKALHELTITAEHISLALSEPAKG